MSMECFIGAMTLGITTFIRKTLRMRGIFIKLRIKGMFT
jgi:hypothetical protein